MVVLYILGALILLITVIMLIRVGLYVSFGSEICVRAKIGPATRQFLPKPEKPKEPKKPKKEKKKKQPEGESKEKSKGRKKKVSLSFEDIRSAFPVLMKALKKSLSKAGRRIKIDPLRLNVVFADDDPAKTAEMYGWGCSVMWTVMPRLEQCVKMPDPRIHLDVDYNAGKTRAEGEIMISLLIRDGIGMALSLGFPMLKWYLSTWRMKKAAEKALTQNGNNQDQ